MVAVMVLMAAMVPKLVAVMVLMAAMVAVMVAVMVLMAAMVAKLAVVIIERIVISSNRIVGSLTGHLGDFRTGSLQRRIFASISSFLELASFVFGRESPFCAPLSFSRRELTFLGGLVLSSVVMRFELVIICKRALAAIEIIFSRERPAKNTKGTRGTNKWALACGNRQGTRCCVAT